MRRRPNSTGTLAATAITGFCAPQAFFPESVDIVDLASRSASGNWFGIQTNTVNLAQTGYVKVKVIDGSAQIGW